MSVYINQSYIDLKIVELYLAFEYQQKKQQEKEEQRELRAQQREEAKLKKEIEERDYQDTHREISPLKKAEDAIELDTSSLTLEEVVEQVLTLIQKAKEE